MSTHFSILAEVLMDKATMNVSLWSHHKEHKPRLVTKHSTAHATRPHSTVSQTKLIYYIFKIQIELCSHYLYLANIVLNHDEVR